MKIIINKKQYDFDEQLLIIDACRKLGIDIPSLCHHPSLSPAASCRLCVVECLNSNSLISSCSNTIYDGMEIMTNSPRVINARRMNLELLLSNHPNDCMKCDANGNCKLQDTAYLFDVDMDSIGRETRSLKIDDSSDFIIRDLNKCVQCQLCVRVCDEIENMNIYSMVNRGHEILPDTANSLPLSQTECVSCGQCATVCPVGAIVEKPSLKKSRWWDLEMETTTCPYCGVGCQLDVYYSREKNEIIRICGSTSLKEVNDGVATCVKGKFGYEFVNHPDRLKKPLIKKNGVFTESGWEEALDYTAAKLKEIAETHSGNSIGFLSSARCTNEENYLIQKLARVAFKTNNVDHCARLCHASTVTGLASTFGSGAMTNNLHDILESDVILVTGANPCENHPVYASRIKKAIRNKGAKLIIADPRRTELVNYASIWLNQRPGTDVALFNGFLKVILDKDLINHKYINERTTGWEELKSNLEKFDLDFVERITGVNRDLIVKAAVMFAQAKAASIIYAMGITQHVCGTHNVMSLANLSMATGNVGKYGGGVNPLRGQNNVQGACDMGGLPNVFPGYQKVSSTESLNKFEEFWNTEKLSDTPGIPLTEMFSNDRIKALFIMGENPAVSDPNSSHVEKRLNEFEFIVDLDIFMNETNRYADVILPAACSYEKNGTFTNTERRVQKINRIVYPQGDSKPDWWIINEISKRLGIEAEYSSVWDITDEIAECTPIYHGIVSKRISGKGIQWPCRNSDDPGTEILHEGKFAFEDGKGRFMKMDFAPPPELPDKEYPFYLSTGRVLYHYHTGTMTRRVKVLDRKVRNLKVEINPEDAKMLDINNGDKVKVISRRGEITGEAKVTEKSMRGLVFTPFHFAEARANRLTDHKNLDPLAKIPSLKVSAVKIEKVK